MGILDPRDPDSWASDAPLIWQPTPPDTSIPCTCGAWVSLVGKRNRCGCGRVYDIYARVIAFDAPPSAIDSPTRI